MERKGEGVVTGRREKRREERTGKGREGESRGRRGAGRQKLVTDKPSACTHPYTKERKKNHGSIWIAV